jgi:hypothetical protein
MARQKIPSGKSTMAINEGRRGMIEVSCGPLTGGGKGTINRSHHLAHRFFNDADFFIYS